MNKEELSKVISATVPMRWADMDAYGHLNNACFFSYFEQARFQWFNKYNLVPTVNPKQGPILAHTECNFLKPVDYPCDTLIHVYAGNPGRSSYKTYHEMTVTSDPETLYATATATMVWVDYQTGKSIPIPDNLRQLITK